MGFLSLIPIKDWAYLGGIAALLIAFGVFTVHERHMGAAKIAAADAALVEAQKVHTQEVENAASGKVAQALADYKASELKPVVIPRSLSHLVCVAPRSGPVPGNGGSAPGSDGASHVPAESDVPFDPAPAILRDGSDADAQVKLLQDYIRACQSQGLCAKGN
jgi:hypothetical protein